MEDINLLYKNRVLKLAENYVRQGKIEAAIDEYEKVIKLDPNAFTTINTLGDLYVRVGRNEEARTTFSRIAKSYCENGFILKAIAMYKKLYKLSPSNYDIPLKIANLYASQDLMVEARQWYNTIADLLYKRGDIRKSLEIYRKAVDLEPDNAALWLQMAERYMKEGFRCEAHEAFLQAGRILLQQKQTSQAAQVYKKAIDIYPNSKPAIKSLVYIFMQNSELKKALILLNQSLEKSPDDIELLTLLGRTCLNADLIDDAESAFTYLLELDKSRYGYLLEVGSRLIKSKQFDRVLAIIDHCADLLISCRQENKAISLLNSIVEIDPGNLQSMEKLAYIYSQTNENDSLIATLKKVVDEAMCQGLNEKATSALNRIRELESKGLPDKERPAGVNIIPIASQIAEQSVKAVEEIHTNSLNLPSGLLASKKFESIDKAEDEPDSEYKLIDINALVGYSNFDQEHQADPEEIDLTNTLFNLTLENNNEPSESTSVLPFGGNYKDIPGREYFNIALDWEWRRAIRSTSPISLILINIAPLISNQESQNAENILTQVAIELNKTIKRGGDLVAIYSSSEIVVLLPNVSVSGASIVANRLYTKIESLKNEAEYSSLKGTTSIEIGMASDIPQRNSSPERLVSAVRKTLCQAKHSANNRDAKTNLHSIISA
jgi:diguanylate cyclase (GGDEF)-like protein